jgi:hypothetical protein
MQLARISYLGGCGSDSSDAGQLPEYGSSQPAVIITDYTKRMHSTTFDRMIANGRTIIIRESSLSSRSFEQTEPSDTIRPYRSIVRRQLRKQNNILTLNEVCNDVTSDEWILRIPLRRRRLHRNGADPLCGVDGTLSTVDAARSINQYS